MLKKFYFSNYFSKNHIFSFFPIVKMAAKYAEIGRVGKLKAGFQLVQIFLNFHNIVLKHH